MPRGLQVLNLRWAELLPCFSGLTDAQRTGKRRNDGPVQVEEVHHFHSGYGPFCCEEAMPLQPASRFDEFLSLLRKNATNWLQKPHVQGTCAVCAFAVANAFMNAIYWCLQEDAIAPRDVARLHVTTRPQGEAFVLPAIAWKSRSKGHSNSHTLWDSLLLLNFERTAKLKDTASLQTKFLRLLVQGAWGTAVWKQKHGFVVSREVPNLGVSELNLLKVTSHTAKRTACQRIGASGAAWPMLLAMQKAENRATALMYQMREAHEYDSVRQLLNAPSALVPCGRVASMLDVLQAVKTSDARLVGRLMQQACALVCVYTTLVYAPRVYIVALVYTQALHFVYTQLCWCILPYSLVLVIVNADHRWPICSTRTGRERNLCSRSRRCP